MESYYIYEDKIISNVIKHWGKKYSAPKNMREKVLYDNTIVQAYESLQCSNARFLMGFHKGVVEKCSEEMKIGWVDDFKDKL